MSTLARRSAAASAKVAFGYDGRISAQARIFTKGPGLARQKITADFADYTDWGLALAWQLTANSRACAP
jgi:hypothetical protein